MVLHRVHLSVPFWCVNSSFHYPLAHFAFLPFPKWLCGINVWVIDIAHFETMYYDCVYLMHLVANLHELINNPICFRVTQHGTILELRLCQELSLTRVCIAPTLCRCVSDHRRQSIRYSCYDDHQLRCRQVCSDDTCRN